jgi:uncharacterized protein YggE
MRHLVAATFAALALSAPAPAALAQAPDGARPPMAMRFDGTFLSVSTEAKASVAPDMATVNAGVVTEAATAEAAMSENATRMNAVMAALKRAGIAERDIQTSNISLNPQYQYNQNEPPKLTGYQAQNTVTVKVRALKNLGKAIDAVVAKGSNQVNGVSFSVADPDPALDSARKEALKKARARADLYAQAAGLKVQRIVSISENAAPPPQFPVPMMARAEMAKAPTPVSPGEVDLSVTLNVSFELR